MSGTNTFTRDGVSIRFQVDGREGAPWIVFSNSICTDLSLWEGQAAALAIGNDHHVGVGAPTVPIKDSDDGARHGPPPHQRSYSAGQTSSSPRVIGLPSSTRRSAAASKCFGTPSI